MFAVQEKAFDPENVQIRLRLKLRADGFQDPRPEAVIAVTGCYIQMNPEEASAIEGVDVIYGSHVFSCVESIEPGKVLLKTGALMAGSTKFEIRVEGHGGHGSQPEACDNPLPALVAMYTAINQIKSFFLRGDTPIVTSIGFIQCGTAMNIIPASGALGGTIRWFLPEDRDLVLRKIREIAESCANIWRIASMFRRRGSPPRNSSMCSPPPPKWFRNIANYCRNSSLPAIW